MKNIWVFLSENFSFLGMKFSIYLNRRVFVMKARSGFLLLSYRIVVHSRIYLYISKNLIVGGETVCDAVNIQISLRRQYFSKHNPFVDIPWHHVLSVSRSTEVQLEVFACSSIPLVLSDNPGISRCLNKLFLLSPHICFSFSFLSVVYFLYTVVIQGWV